MSIAKIMETVHGVVVEQSTRPGDGKIVTNATYAGSMYGAVDETQMASRFKLITALVKDGVLIQSDCRRGEKWRETTKAAECN